MGIFNGYEAKIEAQEKAISEYKNVMLKVANDADEVLVAIPSILEALAPYEVDRKQFVNAVIEALGVELTTASQSVYGSTDETSVTESYPKLTIKTDKLALGDDGNLYIGFDRRKARNGGNAAPVWLKHLISSYKGVTGTIRDNWTNSGLIDKYLLVVAGIDEELLPDIAELDFKLTPDEAIEAQRYGVVETAVVNTPVEIVTYQNENDEELANIYA